MIGRQERGHGNTQSIRARRIATISGETVPIYSNPSQIVLLLRKEVPTEVEFTAASFEVPVSLTPAEALAVAGGLLTAATPQNQVEALAACLGAPVGSSRSL